MYIYIYIYIYLYIYIYIYTHIKRIRTYYILHITTSILFYVEQTNTYVITWT